MQLSNLTTSGWIWFALTVVADLTFLTQAAMCLRWEKCSMHVWPYVPALMTVWLLWLVTP